MLKRARLLSQLDQARTKPVMWVMGPAGFGKTTLVASYIEQRKPFCLWYQLDEGDGDVASFFHYLSLAVQNAVPRYRKPLPHFTAEYRISLNTFTRRFFEELYSRVKCPSALVFDNYHHLPSGSQLHEVLETALETVPEGITWIFMSRALPPPSFAALQARQALHVFNPDALRLSAEEAIELVHLHSKRHGWRPPDRLVEQMHAKTSGWLAGLVLLLENTRLNEAAHETSWSETPEVVFDYLAREVMKGMPPEVRDFLLKTSFLPTMTEAMAEKLTGVGMSGRVLSRLYQSRHFTERRIDDNPTYQYHPLFRDFLMAQARQHFSSSQLREVQQKAAALLEEANEIEPAVALFQAAEDERNLVRVILSHAPILIEQGRAETLEGWLKSLRPSLLKEAPWLLFWLGACTCRVNHDEGQRLFRRAFEEFEGHDDGAGMLSASCGIVESIMATWVNMPQLETWLAKLETLVSSGFVFPSANLEARATFALFMAELWRRPKEAIIRPMADRVEAMLQKDIDSTQAMLLGFYLAVYKSWMADYDAMERVLIRLEQIGSRTSLSPLAQIWLRAAETSYAFSMGDAETCVKGVEKGQETARHYGLTPMAGVLWMNGALGAIAAGDLITAEKYLAETRSLPDQIGLYHHISGWIAALRGDLYEAWRHIESALTYAQTMGALFPEALNRIAAAQVLHEQDKHLEAMEHLMRAQQISGEINSPELICRCDLLQAQFAFDRGDEPIGLQFLQRAMALARAKGIVNWLWWRPTGMASLCAKALERGIDVEFVQHLIRKRKLQPEPSAIEYLTWPWALQIVTLGRFHVLVDGQPVKFSRKTQQRPLDLLKAIIAFGGQEVADVVLTDALWPDAEGDAGLRVFRVTLHRLRKLIGPENIELKGGRVSLCGHHSCFVDATVFERWLDRAESAAQRGDVAAGRRFREKALSLYGGRFLDDESAPWAEPLRERLRRKFIRAILRHREELEAFGQGKEAVEWFEKGLEIDPSAEELRSH